MESPGSDQSNLPAKQSLSLSVFILIDAGARVDYDGCMRNGMVCILTTLVALQIPLFADTSFSDADWVSMGALPGVNGIISAMVKDKNTGAIYIGGQFTVVGSIVATNVAKWNGSVWSSVGNGVGGNVRSLALDGLGNLYVGGAFTNA